MTTTEGFGGAAFVSFEPSPSPPPAQLRPHSRSNEAGPSRPAARSRQIDPLPDRPASSSSGNGTSEPLLSKKAKKRKREEEDKARGKQKKPADYVGPRNLHQERVAAERDCPWATDVEWDACTNPAEMLNAEIDAYYRYMSPTPAEFEVRLLTIEAICRAIKADYPRAEIRPFGSWQTQLYLPHGDIDLVVSIDSFPTGSTRIQSFLSSMAQAVRRRHITNHVVIIGKAKVPIIKFVTTDGRIQVDISVNQTNGLQAGNIISTYLDNLPGARQLILVVKAFLSQRSLNEVFNGGLGSYSVICLVISFMQLHPKVSRDHFNAERNLGVLLMEFFELYGRNFHYDSNGISLLRGGSYFHKKRKGFYNSQKPFLLSIEDPQTPDNDISAGSFGIRLVRHAFAGAYDMLQARLFERVGEIADRRSGRNTADWEPGNMSILNSIMGATKDMIRHRKGLQDLYRSEQLHRMLHIRPDADLSLHVSNFRRPHVIAPWTPARAAAAASVIEGKNGRSRSGVASGSGRNGASNGLAAVMLDDHDTSRVQGEYSSDDEDDMDVGNDTFADTRARAKANGPNGRGGQAAAQGGVAMDEDSDIEEVSADQFGASAASAASSRRANRPGPSSQANTRLGEGKTRMNERYESVSHDEDDFDELVEQFEREQNDGDASSGAGQSSAPEHERSAGQPDEADDGEEESRYAAPSRQGKKRRLNVDAQISALMHRQQASESRERENGGSSGAESESDGSLDDEDFVMIDTSPAAVKIARTTRPVDAPLAESGTNSTTTSAAGSGSGLSIKDGASSEPSRVSPAPTQGPVPSSQIDTAERDANARQRQRSSSPSDRFITRASPRRPHQGSTDPAPSPSVLTSPPAAPPPTDDTSSSRPGSAPVTRAVATPDPFPAITDTAGSPRKDASAPDTAEVEAAESVAAKPAVPKASRQDKRDFWAAKAAPPGQREGEVDEFESGNDYIAL